MCRSYSLSAKFFCSKFEICFLIGSQEWQVCQGCSGSNIGLLRKGNHIGNKAYPIFHFRKIRCSWMLAELNRTMAGVRFKVKFMVAVAPKSHAQIVKACGFLNSAFCYGLYSSTVRVVPARCRHKSVNHTFCSPISKYEVLPGIESEIGGIHMDMKAAGVV